jgi:hypothetical protein
MKSLQYLFKSIFVCILGVSSVSAVEDICYTSSSVSGLMCTPFGGFACSYSTTVKSVSTSTLSDVNISKGYVSFSFTWNPTLEIDNTTKTQVVDNPDNGSSEFRADKVSQFGTSVDSTFGTMGLGFGTGGYNYNLGDFTTDETHSVSDGYLISMGFTSKPRFVAEYIKDGVFYSVPLRPCPGGEPYITISDASVTEGDTGTKTMSFIVSLSNPPSNAGANDKIDLRFSTKGTPETGTTATGGTISPADYVTRTSVTANNLTVNSFPYTFTVTINGDTTIENNESFFLDVELYDENDIDAVLIDSRGVGTILDDDGSGSGGEISSAYGDIIDTSIMSSTDSGLYNASANTGSSAGNTGSSGIKYLRTKIAGSTSAITAVYLNNNNQSADYDNANQDVDSALWILIPVLNDITTTGGCPAADPALLYQLIDTATGQQAVMTVRDNGTNDYSDTRNVLIPTVASSNAKIEFIVVDTSTMNEDAQNCVAVSSTTGNLEGLGQCVNSEVQYVDAYGQTAYDRCAVNATYGKPCLPSNGGVGTGLFASPLGCLMCTFYAGTSCSTDEFSIRPDRFELTSTNPKMPDLLRSGNDYNLTVNAYNSATTVNTLNYNQLKSNMEVSESLKLTKDGSVAILNGTVDWSTTDFNMSNGISISSGLNEVAGVTFDDVAKVNLIVKDKNWAIVDADDTNASCDAMWICGNKNVTFIPDHFSFKDINITNNNGLLGKFTYIANLDENNQSTFTMAARVQATVVAQNKDNNTTLNFTSGSAFYENPVALDMNASHTIHGDANATFISTSLLGFASGEHNITWNENNLSKVLRFNFPRDVNNSVNPFEINASDVNISVLSVYSQTPVSGFDSSANIIGAENGLGNGKATFIYGRTNAPRQVFIGNTGIVPIYYEAYCSGTDNFNVSCSKVLLPNGASSLSTDDPRWFVNSLHISAATPTHGVVGTIEQKNSLGTVSETVFVNNNPYLSTVTYDASKGYPYKTTMENNASSWLIYNRYNINDTNNEFEVEFQSGESGWTGLHDNNVNTAVGKGAFWTNKRLDW